MSDKTIRVREATEVVRTFILANADIGSDVNPDDPVDITAYAFLLRVRRSYLDADGDPQNLVEFTLAGAVVTAADGTFKFTLTTEHTTLVPGQYDAEILFWSSGTVTDPPTGYWNTAYVVEERLGAL